MSCSSRLVLPNWMSWLKSPSAQVDRAGARLVRVRASLRCKVSISSAMSRIKPIISPCISRTSPWICPCWARTTGSRPAMACCTSAIFRCVAVLRSVRFWIWSRVRASSAG
ncbi:hypothetical protein D3C87_1482580 [compost metagenome]